VNVGVSYRTVSNKLRTRRDLPGSDFSLPTVSRAVAAWPS
jgi:hypothetical protein